MLNLRPKRKSLTIVDLLRETNFSLAVLPNGSRARIHCVECECAACCERLMAYGVVQGQIIELVQTSPVYLIRVGETELALDEEVARCVRVLPL